ncbi:MAG TPA: 50S ribosomal protein L13 [Polyangiaceae bacterium]|jgi:large subunit ribosomal protein L13|nr:50S ribosomal protein L13 [Polyangiaceae bacterium]
MSSYVAKPAEASSTRKWWVVDATNQPLGRLASRVASVLRGKHKPTYTPHVDTGDFVIVINADKVKVTGTKSINKFYYTHSGYPGAIRSESFEKAISRHPDLPVTEAVKGMLPKNVLGREMLTKLKVYGSAEHPHVAQKPATLPL